MWTQILTCSSEPLDNIDTRFAVNENQYYKENHKFYHVSAT